MKTVKIFESKDELLSFLPYRTLKNIEIEGFEICLVHNNRGIYAVEDKCPHLKVPLSSGTINTIDEIICSWHSYRFNLKTGLESTGHGLCLKIFSIDILEDGVYLKLH